MDQKTVDLPLSWTYRLSESKQYEQSKKSKKRNWTNETETLVYFISLFCDNIEKVYEHNMWLTKTGNIIFSSLTWEDVYDTVR